MQHLWPGLRRFVDDGRLPLDNNAMERDLRGVVIGRRNHYGSRSERGTQVAVLLLWTEWQLGEQNERLHAFWQQSAAMLRLIGL